MNLPYPYKLLHEGDEALSKASRVGFRVNVEYCQKTIKEIATEIDQIEKELLETKFVKRWKKIYNEKFNLNSSHQLGYYLYTILKFKPPELTDKGKGSTNDTSLSKLDVPELKNLLRIRKLKKIKDTYLENYMREQVNGILHPSFNLGNVISYRPSVSSPNLANVSKHNKEAIKLIRTALVPRKGNLLFEVDYRNLEVYVNAMFHQDPTMLKYLGGGADMHSDISKQIYMLDNFDKKNPIHSKLRFFVKGDWNFSQAYGSYYVNCCRDFCRDLELPIGNWKKSDGILIDDEKTIGEHYISKGIKSHKEFEKFLKDVEYDYWNNRFAVYGKWRDNLWKKYQKQGYIKTPLGFKFQGIMKFKNVINYPAQSTAFLILLWALTRITNIFEERGFNSKVICQIYDAIVFDIDPDELEIVKPIIKKVMTEDINKEFSFINLNLGIDAEMSKIDGNWAEMEGTEI